MFFFFATRLGLVALVIWHLSVIKYAIATSSDDTDRTVSDHERQRLPPQLPDLNQPYEPEIARLPNSNYKKSLFQIINECCAESSQTPSQSRDDATSSSREPAVRSGPYAGNAPRKRRGDGMPRSLARQAIAATSYIPYNDIAARARAIKQFYLDHNIDLTHVQLYDFIQNHHLLDPPQGSSRVDLQSYTTRRQHVSRINGRLYEFLASSPGLSFDDMLKITTETYEKNRLPGNIKMLARGFLSRYGFRSRNMCEGERERGTAEVGAPSRKAMVQHVRMLLRDVPIDDWDRRVKIVDDYYKSHGINMGIRQLRTFFNRHKFQHADAADNTQLRPGPGASDRFRQSARLARPAWAGLHQAQMMYEQAGPSAPSTPPAAD